MPVEPMNRFALGFVAHAETDEIGCQPAWAWQREQVPEEVAPLAGSVKTQQRGQNTRGCGVDVVHAPAVQAREIVDPTRREGVVWQTGKALGRRAKRIVAQWFGALACSVTALAKKSLEQRAAWRLEHAALDACSVIQTWLGKEIDDRSRRAGLQVGGTEHDARQPRMEHGAGTHRARLERDEKLAAVEPVVAERRRARTQCVDLCMCARIMLRHG